MPQHDSFYSARLHPTSFYELNASVSTLWSESNSPSNMSTICFMVYWLLSLFTDRRVGKASPVQTCYCYQVQIDKTGFDLSGSSKQAKFHGNKLSLSENIAKSLRGGGLLFWLTLYIEIYVTVTNYYCQCTNTHSKFRIQTIHCIIIFCAVLSINLQSQPYHVHMSSCSLSCHRL